MNIKYLTLLLSIIGVIILYIISILNQPILIDPTNISEYEGKTISLQATVTDYYTNKYENQIINIQHNNTKITLYVETPIEINNGDKIQVTGKVVQYKNNWEIIINQKQQIQIINKWQNTTTSLHDIATNPTKYISQNLNVTGYIDAKYDEYFLLTDTNNQYQFIVTHTYSKNLTIYPGKQIILKAFFTYDETQTRYKFEINQPEHTIIILPETIE